ncbi:MAG: CopG family transcriptional regulator [Pirellulaceae bacterium]
MVRTQIQLTATQAREIKRIAAARGVSMAEVIRESVDTYLRGGGGNDRTAIKRRALAVTGKFSCGIKDLSTAHDRYFAGAHE